jgi:hypothetical protein
MKEQSCSFLSFFSATSAPVLEGEDSLTVRHFDSLLFAFFQKEKET